ncbi:hypothetical protein [Candidatus Odyssella acanthamoebae]|uniref:Outer membrane protein beta-barrel domain-containing protein n=1 Tax=Candidatus Odyssella acanthamoebae TaxID=91604 RepID=A0A077AVI1_9PROT|nr:hypothetical protein [Candidatus Paracaedibacter acanthamoebae]AIK97162.1 hypothetical protein ID47_11130 [Candidatus Paracaedibacter acanthamoebae]
MKIKYVAPSLAVLLLSTTIGQANASVFGNPYMGVALSWDHMGGKSYGSMINFEGNKLTFTDGRHLSGNKANGYFFFGTSYDLTQLPLFICPEFQIGQGRVNSQLRNTINDESFDLMGNGTLFTQRSLDPKLSRHLNTSLVVRVGGKIADSYRLYGLVGVDVSRFKYTYNVDNVDLGSGAIVGSDNFVKAKWKTAPVFGVGIEKKIDKVQVGLEGRIALYGPIKTYRLIKRDLDRESVSTKVKPYISSLMLRLSYSL